MSRLSVTHKTCGVLMIVSLTITGCLGSRDWLYPPPPDNTYLGVAVGEKVAGSLVVLPLEDKRGSEMREEYWTAAIPFVPHAVATYDRPETISNPEPIDEVSFAPSRDFARALADEIRKAEIFSSVTFVDRDQPAPPSDFVLQGRLYSTQWDRRISTYLLGPLGTVFWMAGLPLGTIETEMEMDMRLTRTEKPGNVLWSFAMEFETQAVDGVYYGLEDSVTSYPKALQDGMRLAISDLVAEVPTHVKPE